jgi:hypothetical protein
MVAFVMGSYEHALKMLAREIASANLSYRSIVRLELYLRKARATHRTLARSVCLTRAIIRLNRQSPDVSYTAVSQPIPLHPLSVFSKPRDNALDNSLTMAALDADIIACLYGAGPHSPCIDLLSERAQTVLSSSCALPSFAANLRDTLLHLASFTGGRNTAERSNSQPLFDLAV